MLPGMKTLVLLVLLAAVAHADGYKGPARPTIPADAGPIATDKAACVKDAEESLGLTIAEGGDAERIQQAGAELCGLRAQHRAARDHLLERLATLVATYKDATNHDHAQRLPATIKAIQGVVRGCVEALASQQYCHNMGCAEEPESNFILCETKAAEILDAIVR